MTLERVDEQYRGLTYPWGRLEHPGDEPFEVAPGVWWLRFTMPGTLNNINPVSYTPLTLPTKLLV